MRIGETGVGRRGPVADFAVAFLRRIVVHDHFVAVPVALARQHHHGTGILEHRHQERNHVTLGIEVLHGFHHAGALEFPSFERLLIVPAVALPERDMAVLQAPGRVVGRRGPGHERGGQLVVLDPDQPLVVFHGFVVAPFPVVAALVVLDGFLVGVERDFLPVLGVFLGQGLVGDGIQVSDLLVAERVVHQAAAQRQTEGAVVEDVGSFNRDIAADGGLFVEIVADGIGHRHEVLVTGCAQGLLGQQEEKCEEEGEERLFHTTNLLIFVGNAFV